MVLSVFLCYIGDNLVTPVILEIQVYIREFYSFFVEKPFKDQPVFNRVNLSDTQAVKDNAGCSTTPDPEQYVVLSGKGNYIPDNQNVIGKLSLLDDFQFMVKPFFYLGRSVGIILRQALITEVGQKLVGGLTLR